MTTMTFTLQGRDQLSRVMDGAGDSAGKLSKALALVGSAIPAAAALAPLIAGTGAAAVAVAAYGVAIGPQIAAMSEAVEAEKKYQDAVEQSGRNSAEAAEASAEYSRQMAKLPPATQEAAAALMVFKDEYKDWSDALAGDTMGPFVKGLALAEAALPRLTPLVHSSSRELDRFMTLIGGTMATPGLDRAAGKFADFADVSLRKANDGLVHLLRSMDGDVGRGLEEFLDYARAQGPLVGETFKNIAEAAINLLAAAADTGVGVLQLANAFAQVVAALPPGFLTVLMQTAIAVKAISIAIAAVKLAAGGMLIVRTQLAASGVAALGASTAMGSLRAAFMAMSLAARTAVAATGIGLLVIGLMKLSDAGKKTPPDVEKLTTSLAKLGDSGKLSGEGLRVLGKDMDKLRDAAQTLAEPSTTQKIEAFFDVFGSGGGPEAKEAAKVIKGVDEALASMVQGGKAELAAAAIERMTKGMDSTQLREFNGGLEKYKAAVADAKFESELAAQAQGVFGAQAQQVQAKLAAQQASADGLSQSINALSNAALMARGGMRGLEAAVDAATAAAKKNGRTLDEGTEKGRANNQALDDLAAATMKAAEAADANGASHATVNGIYDQGKAKLIASMVAMGKTRGEAKKLADQILVTPDKTARLKGNMADLEDKLRKARAKLKAVPDSRKASVRANINDLESKLKQARNKLAGIDGTTAYTYVKTIYSPKGHTGPGGIPAHAEGGPVRGPGTGTSDSILSFLSNGEYVIPAAKVSEYGQPFFDAIRNGSLSRALPVTASTRPAYAGRPVTRGRAGVGSINATFNIASMDPIAVGREVQRVLLRLKRDHGININLGVG